MAIEEGIQLGVLCTTLPFSVETDCSEAVELIQEATPNTSTYVIGELSVSKISRDAKMASHELAKLGRVKHRSNVWFMDLPPDVRRAVDQDSNPPII
jgi:hypothetical protein